MTKQKKRTVKIKAWADLMGSGATMETTIEIPAEDLEGLSEKQREATIFEYVDSWANGLLSSGYEEEAT